MNDVKKQLGVRIRELRTKSKLTQAQLAERADISDEFLSRVERSEKSPSIVTAQKIANGLGVPLKELFEFKNDFLNSQSASIGRVVALLKTADEQSIKLVEKIASIIINHKQDG